MRLYVVPKSLEADTKVFGIVKDTLPNDSHVSITNLIQQWDPQPLSTM